MSTSGSFALLIDRLNQEHSSAERDIFALYVHRLIGLARHRLDDRIQHLVEPEEIANSAIKSFFMLHRQRDLNLEGEDNLWKLLVTITINKCVDQNRRHRAIRRDASREISTDELWAVISGEARPEEEAIANELIDALMVGQQEVDCSIIALRLQSWEVKDIAAQVDRTERTVYRTLAQARQRLCQMNEDLNQV